MKKQYHHDRKEKSKEVVEKKPEAAVKETVKAYLEEKQKYVSKKLPKTDKASREAQTLALLEKFKNKLETVKSTTEESNLPEDEKEDDDGSNVTWLSHNLDFSQSEDAILAKDASTKSDDWYDVYDPRNPINKRKRLMPAVDEINKKKK